MPEWEPVVGLEIHVHLKTRTKMFCRCELAYGVPENTHTCPVCLAHPGSLPVPNERAVEWTIKLGLALGCEIAPRALFHRKNYFYRDLPKGYQISQYDEPLCLDGRFTVPRADGDLEVGIVRAHLEEDAAKSVHIGGAAVRGVPAEDPHLAHTPGARPRAGARRGPTATGTARSPAPCRSGRRASWSSGCAGSFRKRPARACGGSRPRSASSSRATSWRAGATASTSGSSSPTNSSRAW